MLSAGAWGGHIPLLTRCICSPGLWGPFLDPNLGSDTAVLGMETSLLTDASKGLLSQDLSAAGSVLQVALKNGAHMVGNSVAGHPLGPDSVILSKVLVSSSEQILAWSEILLSPFRHLISDLVFPHCLQRRICCGVMLRFGP